MPQFFPLSRLMPVLACVLALAVWVQAAVADVSRFVGEYVGSAQLTTVDGHSENRDMSVSISETKDGFRVE